MSFSQDFNPIKGRGSIQNIHKINIDTSTLSKVFEGYGSLSAGASSRLLFDYPEPTRSEILDYLFKPNFGANILHLKVEIGGDVNSTDGSEPSIAATRFEFENPKSGYFKRGYEYWLMAEARKRNPDIILEGLQWGAPGWIGKGNFYSKDNANFVCSWIMGAKTYWNIDVNYVGIWNERNYSKDYIKLLRNTLNEKGLQKVLIDAGDLWQIHEKWSIADDLLKDSILMKDVGVINSHTSEQTNYYITNNAWQTGKPVWSGESHFYGGDWYAAANWARSIRSYINGRFTKIINWSLISSYHDFLVVPRSGLMLANTPWSGYYEIQPAIWVMAHINQFVKPGWRYLDSACKWWASEGNPAEGLSMVTLKSDKTNDYSIIIETMDAKEPQTLKFKLSDNLSSNDLAVFLSSFKKEEFAQQSDIKQNNHKFCITVFPNSIYSLTTTRGQKKGLAVHAIPNSTSFSTNYFNNFETQELNTSARYFMDQHGTFEVVKRLDNKGKCLKQISVTPGIVWRDFKHPWTIIGDSAWHNYRISVDIMFPDTGEIIVGGRSEMPGWGNLPKGYTLHILRNSFWQLKKDGLKVLATGKIINFNRKWHTIEMIFINDKIEAKIDNKSIVKLIDDTCLKGFVGLGSGWNEAYFDNIIISEIK